MLSVGTRDRIWASHSRVGCSSTELHPGLRPLGRFTANGSYSHYGLVTLNWPHLSLWWHAAYFQPMNYRTPHTLTPYIRQPSHNHTACLQTTFHFCYICDILTGHGQIWWCIDWRWAEKVVHIYWLDMDKSDSQLLPIFTTKVHWTLLL